MFDRNKTGRVDNLRVNDEIRAQEVRLISDSGEQLGIMSLAEAKRMAQEQQIDLIEISPNAVPPVVKIIDYGKYKYQQQKKAHEAKKKQVVIDVKELKLRPNIEKHDLEVKLKKAHEILSEGDKVKLTMQFRGREMAYSQMGMVKFNEIMKSVMEGGGVVESEPKMMGNRIIALVAATKKKS